MFLQKGRKKTRYRRKKAIDCSSGGKGGGESHGSFGRGRMGGKAMRVSLGIKLSA